LNQQRGGGETIVHHLERKWEPEREAERESVIVRENFPAENLLDSIGPLFYRTIPATSANPLKSWLRLIRMTEK
jgi:hypothetical protein